MKAILTLLVLFLSIPAFAADGDRCPAAIRPVDDSGDLVEHCILLCDQKIAADEGGSCDDYTIASLPSYMYITLAEDTECSTNATATINHTGHASLDAHSYKSLVRGGATAVHVDKAGLSLPVLQTTLSNMAGCTDFTVILRMRYQR